jgi:hypothetical protein
VSVPRTGYSTPYSEGGVYTHRLAGCVCVYRYRASRPSHLICVCVCVSSEATLTQAAAHM